MSDRRRRPFTSMEGRRNRNESIVPLGTGKPFVAINRCHGSRRSAGADVKEICRECKVLGLVHGFREVPGAFLAPDQPGEWHKVAIRQTYRDPTFHGRGRHRNRAAIRYLYTCASTLVARLDSRP